ncbi:MAG TPA: hypothetical protein VN457_01855, partial [Chlamydiales bacterium]|nr:hypothetical protein [Chlamydiales bacterium]
MNLFSFYIRLIATSIKSSVQLRGAFLVQAGLMLLNDAIFIVMWWLFFHEFEAIGNWHAKEMAALLAIGMGSYGLMQIFSGGI